MTPELELLAQIDKWVQLSAMALYTGMLIWLLESALHEVKHNKRHHGSR